MELVFLDTLEFYLRLGVTNEMSENVLHPRGPFRKVSALFQYLLLGLFIGTVSESPTTHPVLKEELGDGHTASSMVKHLSHMYMALFSIPSTGVSART